MKGSVRLHYTSSPMSVPLSAIQWY